MAPAVAYGDRFDEYKKSLPEKYPGHSANRKHLEP